MEKDAETLKELVRGLDGLALLGKWEVSLVQDLREKAESLLDEADREDPPEPGLLGEPE